ncbi:MAG TPA: M14 family metallopeptidase [Gemmatimonadales bacterium]|nr:M14 family metallopeptidase [Gemmatimonadales bacterium]
MRIPVLVLGATLAAAPLAAQLTTPERTGHRETSSHADVLRFLDSLQRRGADLRIWTLATGVEGRPVPVVLAARPMVDGPAAAHRSGKPIVYLQGNIHAGEVEGKEAVQMLLRDLTLGPLRPLLDSVILLAVPIYNADGNEHWGPAERNRPGQNGPAVLGERGNGQGLDLNRDYVKLEAPETRGALALLDAWDPDLFIDLHTTNGSYHGYALTFSPGLNPNSPAANDYVRDRFLPAVRRRMRERHRWETFWYGNFRNQEPDSLVQGWETYDPRPRFGTNWVGMRGRLAILSEAYSNDPFERRIRVTYDFVREILGLAAEERQAIRAAVAASDRWRPDSVTVRSAYAAPTVQDVVAELTRPAGDGAGPFARRERTGVFRAIRMPVYDRFAPARRERIPAAYLLPPRLAHVAALLRRHGVVVHRLGGRWSGPAERFAVDSLVVLPLFEGHRTVQVEGRWRPAEVEAGPGWFYVPTDQRLGVFAAYLLEPASEDGVVTWNLLDRELRKGGLHPIARVAAPLAVEMRLVDD